MRVNTSLNKNLSSTGLETACSKVQCRSIANELNIENVFIVNLSQFNEDIIKAEESVLKANIKAQRFDAIDTALMQVKAKNKKMRNVNVLNTSFSHWMIFRNAVENGLDSIMVFEDSLELHENYQELVSDFLDQLPSDWEFVWLGWNERRNSHPTNVSSMIAIPDQIKGTNAYIVRGKELILKIYQRLTVIDEHTDIILSELTKKISKVYKSNESLFIKSR